MPRQDNSSTDPAFTDGPLPPTTPASQVPPKRAPFSITLFNPSGFFMVAAAFLSPLRYVRFLIVPLALLSCLVAAFNWYDLQDHIERVLKSLGFWQGLAVSMLSANLFSRLVLGTVMASYDAPPQQFRIRLMLGILPRFSVDRRPIRSLGRAEQRVCYMATILARLFLFGIGIFAWNMLRRSGSGAAEFFLALGILGGTSFVFVSNPLWPADGYNWLANKVNRPRLRQSAFKLLTQVVSGRGVPTALDRRETSILLLFAVGCIVFTTLLLYGILSAAALALERRFQGNGVLMFCLILAMMVLYMVSKRSQRRMATGGAVRRNGGHDARRQAEHNGARRQEPSPQSNPSDSDLSDMAQNGIGARRQAARRQRPSAARVDDPVAKSRPLGPNAEEIEAVLGASDDAPPNGQDGSEGGEGTEAGRSTSDMLEALLSMDVADEFDTDEIEETEEEDLTALLEELLAPDPEDEPENEPENEAYTSDAPDLTELSRAAAEAAAAASKAQVLDADDVTPVDNTPPRATWLVPQATPVPEEPAEPQARTDPPAPQAPLPVPRAPAPVPERQRPAPLKPASSGGGGRRRSDDLDRVLRMNTHTPRKRTSWARRIVWVLILGLLGYLATLPYQLEVGGEFTIQPVDRAEVRTRTDGEITEIRVQEGDWVSEGQILAVLSNWDEQRDISVRSAELSRLQAELDGLIEGPSPTEIAVAEQRLSTAMVQVEIAQEQLDLQQQLYDRGTTTKSALDDANADLRLARAEAEEARATLVHARTGPTESEIAAARAEIVRHEEDLRFADLKLAQTFVRAVTEGQVVGSLSGVPIGTYLPEGGLFVELEDNRTLVAEIEVPETLIGEVQPGARAEMRFWADANTSVFGTVERVAPKAEEREFGRVLRVQVDVPNPDGRLAANMTGQGKIDAGTYPVWQVFSRIIVRFFEVELWSWLP
ncbi:MAG: efflux RND transporter periplasmic adaptor subunit [Pseudomonadota bacterium]